ncbi:hypothetical protein [Streptomyces sp. NPDC047130]|uniref:hypothetical protein n=1 Tax=Streptomyces sp. NPDC047130 TaxID=3155261 RepID=UPI0033FC0632
MSDQTPKEPEEAVPTGGTAPGEPEAPHTEGTPAAEPEAEAEAGAGAEPGPEAVPGSAAPRRRGRTTALIAAAAVLGLVGGTCAGYLIQADRAPTKLPSLSQPELKQAEGEGPDPLPAAQDRKVRTDGDLRKLLVKKPEGAKDLTAEITGDGWMEVPAFAETFDEPGEAFSAHVAAQLRRIAVVYWEKGNQFTEVRLAQYRHEEYLEAAELTERQNGFAEGEGADSRPLPGTADGMVHVLHEPTREAGYLPMYQARAFAYRGDISLQIWITDSRPIPKKTIMDLAKRQMERL